MVPPRGRGKRCGVRVDVPRKSVPAHRRVGHHASGAGAHDRLGHVGYVELRVELAEPRLQLRSGGGGDVGSSNGCMVAAVVRGFGCLIDVALADLASHHKQ